MDQKLAAAYGVHELRNPTEMSTAICKGNRASVLSLHWLGLIRRVWVKPHLNQLKYLKLYVC